MPGPFDTNLPRTATGLPADAWIVVRMKVEENISSGVDANNKPIPTEIVRAKAYNGKDSSETIYLVYCTTKTRAKGQEIFAARPLGGTPKSDKTLPVEWIEVFAPAPAVNTPPGGRRWDVWSTIDDVGTQAWTRPRFTDSNS
jgi:hypothetical protein